MNEVKSASFTKSMLILSGSLAAIGLLVYTVTRHPLNHYSDTKVIHFKNHNTRLASADRQARIADELGLDVLNHWGINGKVEYAPSTGELSMIIRNRHGQHIPGLEVFAQLSRTNGQLGPRLMMRQNAKKHYAAPVRGIDAGRWHVAIQAFDRERRSGEGVMFQIEKYLRFK